MCFGVEYEVESEKVTGVKLIEANSGDTAGLIILKSEQYWHKIPVDYSPSAPPPLQEVEETIDSYFLSLAESNKKEAVLSPVN